MRVPRRVAAPCYRGVRNLCMATYDDTHSSLEWRRCMHAPVPKRAQYGIESDPDCSGKLLLPICPINVRLHLWDHEWRVEPVLSYAPGQSHIPGALSKDWVGRPGTSVPVRPR